MKRPFNRILAKFFTLAFGWVFILAFAVTSHGFAQADDNSNPLINPALADISAPDHSLVAAWAHHLRAGGGTQALHLTEKITPNLISQGPLPPKVVDTGKIFNDHALMITNGSVKNVGIIYAKETGTTNTATAHFQLYQGPITAASTPVISDQLPVTPQPGMKIKGVDVEHIGNEYHAVVTAHHPTGGPFGSRYAYYFKRPVATTGTWTLVNTIYIVNNRPLVEVMGRGVELFPRAGLNETVIALPEIVQSPCASGPTSQCGRVQTVFYNYATNTIRNTSLLTSSPATNFWVGLEPTTIEYERFHPVSGAIDSSGKIFMNLHALQFNNQNPFKGIGIYNNVSTQTTFSTNHMLRQPATNIMGNDMEAVTGGYNLITIEDGGAVVNFGAGGRDIKHFYSTTGTFNFSAGSTIATAPPGDFFYSPATTKDVNGRYYHGVIARVSASNITQGWAFFLRSNSTWGPVSLFTTPINWEGSRLKMKTRAL